MKKISVLVFCVFTFVVARAQHPINSFFAPDGTVRLETQELSEVADSIVTLKHRTEDVVWRRDIYRVIDMRLKQNFQLYYPTDPNDPTYKSLFRLILDAVQDGLSIYSKNRTKLKPIFSDSTLLHRDDVENFMLPFWVGSVREFDREETGNFLLNYDSINGTYSFEEHSYNLFIKNQTKYVLYEVIFFDKSTSRMYRKTVAIAPLQPDLEAEGLEDPGEFMRNSVMFWMLYDELRPYLAARYIIPTQNESKRVSFEEFFEKHLYSSYIIGEGNMYDRMILDYCLTEKEAKQEQDRIEYELLTFEQDLWEY